MYRVIIKEDPERDGLKSHYDIMREVYDHTENKVDLERNTMATFFALDPLKFKDKNDEANRVLKSNIAWPKGYIPE